MFLKTLKHVLGRKVEQISGNEKTKAGSNRPNFGVIPLNMVPGSGIEISEILQVVNESRGGALPPFDNTRIVHAIGRLKHSGVNYIRAHLSEGKAFLEVVPDQSDASKLVQLRLFVQLKEILPSVSDWNLLLARDEGIIGWQEFQVDATETSPAHIFQRVWASGSGSWIPPIEAQESVLDGEGGVLDVRHRMMLYGRTLGERPEYLLADVVETPDRASVKIYVGVDLSPSEISVFANSGNR